MNKGGSQQVGDFNVTMTHAMHSNSIEDDGEVVYAGEPAGYIVRLPGDVTLYHAGDTAVFGDMKLIAELYRPQIALLPIGDLFTMGPREAAMAIRFPRCEKCNSHALRDFPGAHWQLQRPCERRPKIFRGSPFSRWSRAPRSRTNSLLACCDAHTAGDFFSFFIEDRGQYSCAGDSMSVFGTLTTHGVWASGKLLIASHDAVLPPYCIKCGRPADANTFFEEIQLASLNGYICSF